MNELVDLDLRIDRDHAAAARAEEDARKIIVCELEAEAAWIDDELAELDQLKAGA